MTVLPALLLTAATLAAPAPPLDDADPAGDVRVTRDAGAATRAERRAIDLLHVRSVDRGDEVRFLVTIGDVLDTEEFDQMVFVDLVATAAEGRWDEVNLGWSPQQPRSLGYSAAYDVETDTYRSCTPNRLRVRPGDVLVADFPERCLVRGEVQAEVTTVTGIFRSNAPVLSMDRLVLEEPRRVTDPPPVPPA